MKFQIKAFVLFVALGFVFGSSVFSMSMGNKEERGSEEEMFCAADAKLCPDGSYVARDPKNNCEFRLCPGEAKATLPFQAESCSSSKSGEEACSKEQGH